MPRGFGSVASGEVGYGPGEATLRALALADARREGGGANYTVNQAGDPVAGAAAQNDLNRRLDNEGIRPTQVALHGGLLNFLASKQGGGVPGQPDGVSSGGSSGGQPLGSRVSLGFSPADQTVANIVGLAPLTGPVGALIGAYSRLFGRYPAVIGGPFAPRPQTPAFAREIANMRAAENARSQGLGGGFPGPSGIP